MKILQGVKRGEKGGRRRRRRREEGEGGERSEWTVLSLRANSYRQLLDGMLRGKRYK